MRLAVDCRMLAVSSISDISRAKALLGNALTSCQYCSSVGADKIDSISGKGHLQYFVKAVLSTNGILCQILIETTQIPQILINLLLNMGWLTIEHKLRLC